MKNTDSKTIFNYLNNNLPENFKITPYMLNGDGELFVSLMKKNEKDMWFLTGDIISIYNPNNKKVNNIIYKYRYKDKFTFTIKKVFGIENKYYKFPILDISINKKDFEITILGISFSIFYIKYL
jgi:hypothetical protein